MDLTVILPAHDEEESLPALVASLRRAFQRHGIDGEIVAVDDGSTDGTGAVLADLADEWLRVVTFPVNRGRAHGIAAGFDAARGWAVAVMDSDGQYEPDDLAAMLAALRSGADVANGVRTRRADTPWRRLVSWTYNLLVMRALVGVAVADANSGLKAFRADALGRLAFDPDGFRRGHRYLIAWASRRGLEVVEVPIRHYPRMAGRSYIRAFREARYTLLDHMAFRRAMASARRRDLEAPASESA